MWSGLFYRLNQGQRWAGHFVEGDLGLLLACPYLGNNYACGRHLRPGLRVSSSILVWNAALSAEAFPALSSIAVPGEHVHDPYHLRLSLHGL